ncbi:hypothetical protein SUGI_0324240 [Cryptomeria japonica]|uniref:dof zinc finger protein DOF5.4 n=1 Tax=Cryptomeria japonica TaxID=3369 RepID=UPI002408D632|nr:dof zinc finger protein DOF5.4 [Cryptomeria japonica]GLJ18322.1 hypothetical protein SUGI_0324240 [Cryptomeria japonica]
MLNAAHNVCNQRFAAPSLEMFAMQDQSGVLDSTLNSMLLAPAVASTSCNRALGRTRPHPSQILKCPRCDSINTKFCYYNNYNLSQPRHFCKTCRRYWTKGGVLRNVPVGGGCRKNNHNRKSKPRNNTPPADKSKSKSTSNSAATVSSSESSPLTVNNNNNIQETTSSSTSFNSSTGYRFGSELGEILNGNYKASDQCTTAPIPRLLSGTDYFHQPDFLNSENLSSSIDANSSSYSNLLGASNYVGLSFSDIQHKLAGFSSNNVQEPCPAAPQVFNFNNISCNSHTNSKTSMTPSDWQVNNNIETLLEDSYCWGAEPQAMWSDQEPIYLPEGI